MSKFEKLTKRQNLFFVGIDVIGDYLTEINVTSPTGIQELERFNQRKFYRNSLGQVRREMENFMKYDKVTAFGIFAMAIVVVSSNVLVQFYFGSFLTYGAFTYPLAFLVNDLINKFRGPRAAQKVIFWGFLVGVFLLFFRFSNSRRVWTSCYFENCNRLRSCFSF